MWLSVNGRNGDLTVCLIMFFYSFVIIESFSIYIISRYKNLRWLVVVPLSFRCINQWFDWESIPITLDEIKQWCSHFVTSPKTHNYSIFFVSLLHFFCFVTKDYKDCKHLFICVCLYTAHTYSYKYLKEYTSSLDECIFIRWW